MKEYIVNGKKVKLNVFESIRDFNDAYLIGYLMGDGGFCNGKGTRTDRMFICSSDKGIVESFLERYQPDAEPCYRIPVNNTRPIKSNTLSSRMTFSTKFSETFRKYGLMNIKEDRYVVNISKVNYPAFLLGLFDSDGCISWGRRKDRNRLWCNFCLFHPSLKVLSSVQDYLASNGIITTIKPKGEEKCFVLRTSDRTQMRKIYDLLYSFDVELKIIERKKKAFRDFLSEYEA